MGKIGNVKAEIIDRAMAGPAASRSPPATRGSVNHSARGFHIYLYSR
jgi:hypothetical protein